MTSSQNLGRLAPVDLRDYWSNEATDFTPWLAQAENITLLGDALGLELEVQEQEAGVGPFRADILCRDTITNHYVLIENQLERTDHTHLGQLLTYAAGLEAVTIVWVAQRFVDEHRAALDWLNRATNGEINFFGLEIELWQIGESPAAPKFNIVSSPNDWARSTADAAAHSSGGELSELRQLQVRYWTALKELAADGGSPIKFQNPGPLNWTAVAVGRTHFSLYVSTNSVQKRVSVGLACEGPDADAHYRLLLQDRAQIEADVGEELRWYRDESLKGRWISLGRDIDPTDEGSWSDQHDWILQKLEAIQSALSQRVKALNADDWIAGT